MRGLGTGLFLLWIIVTFHKGYCNYAEILWGQCHVFCLKRYQLQLQKVAGLSNVPLNPDIAIQECRKDKECKWCLHACQRPQKDYSDHEGCMKHCRHPKTKRNHAGRGACFGGCRFILNSKEGICPPHDELSPLQAPCIDKCQSDVTCNGMSKCCKTSCGRVCLNVFPDQPENLRFKERKDGGLLVKWDKSKSPEFTAPVIYILRWWCPYTSGVRYSITTKLKVRLSGYPDGVHPAVRCNYMLASINTKGSQGFTSPIGYLKKFLHPSPPQNLQRTRRKLHDGKVDVTLRWQPPEFTDGIDVDRYVVFWSDGLPSAGTSYTRLHMNRKTVRSAETSYTIPSLEPGITYFVQVRAIVEWRGKSIRGQPASDYIESFSTPLPAEEDVGKLRQEFPTQSRVNNIMVDEPMFMDSKLKARASWSVYSETAVEKYVLYWTLDVCEGEAKHRKTPSRLTQEATTYKQEYHLFGLESGCVYELKIHTVSFFGDHGEAQQQFFRTPPCWKTKGRTSGVLCESKVSPPLPPQTVEINFLPTCSCQAVVSWLRPDQTTNWAASGQARIFVKWGQSRPPLSARSGVGDIAVVYNAEPYSISLSGNLSKVCTNYLKPGNHYTVQVSARVGGQSSPPAVKHFTTPIGLVPCFSLVEGDLMQSDQSSPAGSVLASLDVNEDKHLKQDVTQASIHVRSLAAPSSVPNAEVVFLCIVTLLFKTL